MITEITVALISLLFLLGLFLLHDSRKTGPFINRNLASETPDLRIPCPLCGNKLNPGEKLHSELVRKKNEKTTGTLYIYGCPRCYPRFGDKSKAVQKKCPVCSRKLGTDEYAIGFYRELPDGRKRAHVTGCILCSRGRTGKIQAP